MNVGYAMYFLKIYVKHSYKIPHKIVSFFITEIEKWSGIPQTVIAGIIDNHILMCCTIIFLIDVFSPVRISPRF